MYSKKISIYVEGQTEQIFLNHILLTWWNFSGIEIKNLKLFSFGHDPTKIQDFSTGEENVILFLLIDVQGDGSFVSALANRANKQHQDGFEIIGLRDLLTKDYEQFQLHKDPAQAFIDSMRKALKVRECQFPQRIDIFFAVMEIEAWLLSFSTAISKWADVSEDLLKKEILNNSCEGEIEKIKSPSKLVKEFSEKAGRKKPKSLGGVISLVKEITREEINDVYISKKVPSFNKFWDKLISLTNHNQV